MNPLEDVGAVQRIVVRVGLVTVFHGLEKGHEAPHWDLAVVDDRVRRVCKARDMGRDEVCRSSVLQSGRAR